MLFPYNCQTSHHSVRLYRNATDVSHSRLLFFSPPGLISNVSDVFVMIAAYRPTSIQSLKFALFYNSVGKPLGLSLG